MSRLELTDTYLQGGMKMSKSGLTAISNYEFCAQWVIDRSPSTQVRVLDYGCGSGEIIRLLRAREVTAVGCDLFYAAGTYPELENSDLLGTAISEMIDEKIPFEDNCFDFVISNQVLEHVEDLDLTLTEFQRVLKPGGQILSVFPDKSVWREGHCDIPFLHWFPKGSNFRVYYAFLLRSIGMGSFKGDKSPMQWSQDICLWLDKWTHYRSTAEINRQFTNYFNEIHSIESEWLQQRLGHRQSWVSWLPQVLQQSLARKLGGRVIVARNI
jgi:SAM-dependent methyltransferase